MKHRRRKVAATVASGALAVTLLVVGGSANAAISVDEDFEQGVAHGFTVATGTYAVVADGSKVYRTTSDSARAVVGDAATTDVQVQASIKVAGGTPTPTAPPACSPATPTPTTTTSSSTRRER
ncbi:hypothetical protein [Kitasatospora sp. NPDC094015]|uniref:hypothetical protein n=1 Tax=Kitasatospora sp. NPDC094015 TaxID=3155205 RepID=UPI0033236BF0